MQLHSTDKRFLKMVSKRLILDSIIFSFFGYAFSGSFLFWKWHWFGIVLFALFLMMITIFAAGECLEKEMKTIKQG